MSRQRFGDLSGMVRGGGFGLPPTGNEQPPGLMLGRVTVAPVSASGDMTVTPQEQPGLSSLVVPGGQWASREGALPTVGAMCLIVKDDCGDAWVPMWAGADAPPSLGGSPLPSGPLSSNQGYVWNGTGWSIASIVSKFNGRSPDSSGNIAPAAGDYSISQITFPAVLAVQVPITAPFGGGTASICRKLGDGTVEWFTNLYTTGQPSANQIQVTTGLSSALLPAVAGGNNGYILASYDGAAYYATFTGGDLWVRTLDGSSRTEWNPIFNSLRYSTVAL